MTATDQNADDADVFNLAQPARVEGVVHADVLAADSDDASERARPGASPLRDKIVKGCIVLFVFVGASWIVFPEWFSSSSTVVTSTLPQTSSLQPQQAIQADASSRGAEYSAVDEAPSEALADSVEIGSQSTEAPYQAQPRPSSEVAQALEDPGNAKLVDAINGLNANQQELARRLVSLDERVTAIGKQPARNVVQTGVRPQPEPSLKPTLYRDYRPGVAKASRSIPGYELNSIYRGMAWIRAGERVHAVRPGDQFQGLTITAIDVPNRVVRTNRGDIR